MIDEELDPPTFPINQLGSQPRSPFASLTAWWTPDQYRGIKKGRSGTYIAPMVVSFEYP